MWVAGRSGHALEAIKYYYYYEITSTWEGREAMMVVWVVGVWWGW